MLKGRVKYWNEEGHFGFITIPGFPSDLFVHHTSIRMSGYRILVAGEDVEFLVKRDEKGWKAVNVVPTAAHERTA